MSLLPRRTPSTWARSLPAALRPEDVRVLHKLSKCSGRTIRRIVTDSVTSTLDEAREAWSRAA